MASKRAVLETLKVKDLVLLADKFEIQLENRRKKDDVVASVAKSRKAPLGELLGALPLATLKASCATLAIEGKGRSKADFIALLTGPAPKKTATAKKTAAAAKTTATKKKAVTKKKAATKPKADKAPAKKKAAVKKKTTSKSKAEETAPKKKATSKKKPAAKPKAKEAETKKAETKKKAVAKKKPATAKAETATTKKKAAPKKKTPKINKAAEAEAAPVKREADPEPRQAVLDKVASIKPAETSQPDYSKIKREVVGFEFRRIQCPSCSEQLKIATCQAHQCSTVFISSQRKICASCWYERSSVSIGEYLDEEKIDTHCGSCGEEIDLEAAPSLKSA